MKTLKIPKLSHRAQISPNSYNESDRTIEVVASTGARVRRVPFFEEPYIEKLDMSSDAINLERFSNGAPVLANHDAWDVRQQIGVVLDPRLENNQLKCRVKFSERDNVAGLVKDIEQGIVRNVSIGYVAHEITELDELDRGMKVKVATAWTPHELSFVTIPADAQAGTRSAVQEFECTLIERKEMFEQRVVAQPKTEDQKARESAGKVVDKVADQMAETPKEAVVVDEKELRSQVIANEQTRFSEIVEACTHADVGLDRAAEFFKAGKTANEVRKSLLADLKTQEKEVKTVNLVVGENNERLGTLETLERSLLNRLNPSKNQLKDSDVRAHTLLDLARETIAMKGDTTRGLSPNEIATRALHSSSDFPILLQNVMNKELRAAYEEAPATWGSFTRSRTVTDFKEIVTAQMGDFSKLLPKNENGEYVAGSTSEASEKYTMNEYGRSIRIGRQLLINDDLNAFARMPEMMGRQARNLEADTVIAELTSNPLMADGNALFSVAHANLLTGASVSIASLAEARKSMRLQKSLGGSLLNLRPSWMYVPVALETSADQIITQITPNSSGQVNPFSSNGRTSMMAMTDPRLDEASATSFYVFADLADIDMFEIAYLQGETAPYTDQMMDFDTDGMKLKIRHTFGVKAIDWRGMVKLDA